MPSFSSNSSSTPEFLPLMQALARAAQAVAMFDSAAHRASATGLTASQADVLFTLGGTDGMTCSDITAQTLITKGTLTGVIDRLRAKGLVERWEDAYDARRTIIALTSRGESLYDKAFPAHIDALNEGFAQISPRDRQTATRLLEKVAEAFSG